MLTLDIPAGAMPAQTEVTIGSSTVDASALGSQTVSDVYELAPDGLEFETPATATIRLPGVATTPSQLPLLGIVLVSGDSVEVYVENSIEVVDDAVVLTAPIAHFSDIAVARARIDAVLQPSSVVADPGTTFDASASISWSVEDYRALGAAFERDVKVDATWFGRGQVERSGVQRDTRIELGYTSSQTFRCGEGDGTYGADVRVAIDTFEAGDSLLPDLFGITNAVVFAGAAQYPVAGVAQCVQGSAVAAPPADIQLESEVVIEVAASDCATVPAGGTGTAEMVPDDPRDGDPYYRRGPGWALQLDGDLAPFLQVDSNGDFIAGIEPRPSTPGAWTDPAQPDAAPVLPTWDVISVTVDDESVTVVVDETRFSNAYPPPDGCRQRLTYRWTIPGLAGVTDFMLAAPSATADVSLVDATSTLDGDVVVVEGQLEGATSEILLLMWVECSGEVIGLDAVPVEVAADGSFRVEVPATGCVVVNMKLTANGTEFASASASGPAG